MTRRDLIARLFIPIYAAIAAALLVAAGAALTVGFRQTEQEIGKHLTMVAQLPALWVATELQQAHDVRLRASELEQALGYPVRLLTPEAAARLPPSVRQDLEHQTVAGKPSMFDPTIYVGSPAGVVQLGPFPQVWTVQVARGVVAMLAVLVVLSVGLLAVLRPLQVQLGALTEASARFGAGELQARVTLSERAALRPVADSFNGMAAQIASLVSSHQELLRAVSHELRTPLARLRMSVELLRNVDDREQRGARLDRMDRDLAVLDDLVGELLQVARLQEGAPPLASTRVELAEVLRRVAADLAHLGKPIDVQISEVVVRGDARLLERAVLNLTKNACRHARSQVRVTLADRGDAVDVLVDDDGVGVPEAHRTRIFEPFVRLQESRSRDTGGAGLGLSIVSRIADRHGGSVAVRSSPWGGARFILTLPSTTSKS